MTRSKVFIFLTAFFFPLFIMAQPAKKPGGKEKIPTQSDINKMMEDAMKDMSEEEKNQVKEALQLGKEMQQKGMTGNSTAVAILTIPKKQTALLAKIPKFTSKQQYITYLTDLLAISKRRISASILTETDKLFLTAGKDPIAQANIGPLLLLQKKPEAAIYASIKTAMSQPDNILLQDNLAVILHQTGYPQKALPILKFLLIQNRHPVILNNIAQSYLTLGEKDSARAFFLACLKKDADHCEANCGMGLPFQVLKFHSGPLLQIAGILCSCLLLPMAKPLAGYPYSEAVPEQELQSKRGWSKKIKSFAYSKVLI